MIGPGFREQVYFVVQQVPAGYVTTYGDVASMLGSPRVARQVGFALSALPFHRGDVPWHRVINAKGSISFRGDDLRGERQKNLLLAEGVEVLEGGILPRFDDRRYRYESLFFSEVDPPLKGR